jgi:Protein of unknown function (DUF732)
MRRLLVLLGTVSALALAAPTSAEPGVDGSFIDALSKAGITFNDPSSAVEAGHTTCDLISQGKPALQVVQLVQQQNSGISTIAVSAYCPQYVQQANAGTGQSQSSGGGVAGSGSQQ